MITEGNVSDIRVARQFHFDPGTIVVDDRGYNGLCPVGADGAPRAFSLSPE